MFVENMSPEAILKEVNKDLVAIEIRREKLAEIHRRDFLFAKKYPVTYYLHWKSPHTYNQWHIGGTCNSKKEANCPDTYYYATFNTNRGVGIVFPNYNINAEVLKISKYTAHFFHRYRTRYLVPNGLYTPGMDVPRYFVDTNTSFYFTNQEDKSKFTCILKDGIALGVQEHAVSVFCTFLSKDMLFKMQERVLHSSIEHQKLLDDFINDRLNNSHVKYHIQGRVGRVAGPEPMPKLPFEEVKDLLKNKPNIPLFIPPPPKIEFDE